MISPLAYVDPAAKIGSNVTIKPFAYIEGDVEIGDNCLIMPHASVLEGTRLGKNNKIHQGAVLGAEPQDFHYKGDKSFLFIGDNNDFRENVVISRATCKDASTTIGNNNSLMDGVHLCHDVKIKDNCVLGIKSTLAGNCILDDNIILSNNVLLQQDCHIGSWTFIKGGCRISKDVPPYTMMAGNPAAYHGINAVILSHHKMSERILRHITNTYRLIYQGNISIQDALIKIEEQIPMSEEIENIIQFIKDSKCGIVWQ
ncbi:acyl-ACP--UDP-N-acetylglucosamine O-acyltransferase [Bacteroidaceae bacterium HV4-6-C5C]|jgi:UDP-N-acetylglucosamine acyltransferase|nr:acyl-ACP--UDP-N-acetylglucosamine O-acyltransferase [Bacteroidaceae bacterium HV4-6-C5C]